MAATAIACFAARNEWPSRIFALPTMKFFELDFSSILAFSPGALSAVTAYMLVMIFDIGGAMFGLGKLAGIVEGNVVPGSIAMFLAAATGTAFGALTGTTPLIIAAESAVGIKEGGRTGLVAVTVSMCFMVSLFLAPLIQVGVYTSWHILNWYFTILVHHRISYIFPWPRPLFITPASFSPGPAARHPFTSHSSTPLPSSSGLATRDHSARSRPCRCHDDGRGGPCGLDLHDLRSPRLPHHGHTALHILHRQWDLRRPGLQVRKCRMRDLEENLHRTRDLRGSPSTGFYRYLLPILFLPLQCPALLHDRRVHPLLQGHLFPRPGEVFMGLASPAFPFAEPFPSPLAGKGEERACPARTVIVAPS